MTTRLQYATAVLQKGDWPVTTANLDALVAQQVAEGCQAEFNPMATTEPAEGATDFNEVHVKNYPSLEVGVDSVVATLKNGDYPRVTNALALGNSALNVANAWAAEPWGTEPFDGILSGVETDRTKFYDELIVGTTTQADGSPVLEPEPTLELGSSGEWVVTAQQDMVQFFNQHIAVDGEFGELTRLAVMNVQRFFHLSVDGIIGTQTWDVLDYVKVLHAS